MCINTLIIIPARSGSKGIAHKNIKPLAGEPLLYWSHQAVQDAQLLNSLTILSTDSQQYAQTAEQFQLSVPFIRPVEFARDQSSAFSTARHAIDWFEEQHHYQPEQIMWLQPTSPFRSPAIIKQAIKMMADNPADAIIGCRSLDRDRTTLFECKPDYLTPLSRSATQTRRQDISPLLTPNGAMYLIKTSCLLQTRGFFPKKSLPLVMDNIMSHDIDTQTDWLMAEAYIKNNLTWIKEPKS